MNICWVTSHCSGSLAHHGVAMSRGRAPLWSKQLWALLVQCKSISYNRTLKNSKTLNCWGEQCFWDGKSQSSFPFSSHLWLQCKVWKNHNTRWGVRIVQFSHVPDFQLYAEQLVPVLVRSICTGMTEGHSGGLELVFNSSVLALCSTVRKAKPEFLCSF